MMYKNPVLKKFCFWSFSCIIVLNLSLSLAQAWELVKNEEGIQVYTRSTDTDLDEFKGITHIQSSLASFVAIMNDTPTFVKWFHNCTESKLLKKPSQFERYTYLVNDVPWPVADRELIVYTRMEQDPGTKVITLHMKAEPQLIPQTTDLVRIPKMRGYWRFTPQAGGVVEVINQVYMDPGGSIPGWLANMTAVDLPYYTLLNMKKVIKDLKYQQAHYDWMKD